MISDADVVPVTAYVETEDGLRLNLRGRCSGEKTLMEYVRPKIQRELGLRLAHRGRRVILQLIRTREDCEWTTPVKELQVFYISMQ